MKLKKQRKLSRSSPKLLILLIPALMLCMTGCQGNNDAAYNDNSETITALKNAQIPEFPKPSKECGEEMKRFVPKEKCPHLYSWLGKVMIFEKQLGVLKNETL